MQNSDSPASTRFGAALDRIVAGFLVALMAVMVVTVTWQVITRFILSSPSSYTEELATYLLIWISLIGGAYALRLQAHLGIDLVVRSMQAGGRRRARIFGLVVVGLFALLGLVVGGFKLVFFTLQLDQRSAAFQVPVGYVYMALPLSGLLMIYYCASAFRRLLAAPSEELDLAEPSRVEPPASPDAL